ncbi:MAG: hypothetical protein QM770_01175 [Tepidisphaeraceae bacterium]
MAKLRMASYARDFTATTHKFDQLNALIAEAKSGDRFDGVLVESPQVLGDTYDELLDNLNALASAKLMIAIVPPEARRVVPPGAMN